MRRALAALERRGIHVLENTVRPIDARLWVVGVGDDARQDWVLLAIDAALG